MSKTRNPPWSGKATELTWHEHVALAEHHHALGWTEINLLSNHNDTDWDRPWEFVTATEAAGTHRMEMATSVRFTAEHPSGLTFSWVYDVEPYEANGAGTYQFDVPGVTRILGLLPAAARTEFRAYLGRCAEALMTKAGVYQGYADRQRNDAKTVLSMLEAGR